MTMNNYHYSVMASVANNTIAVAMENDDEAVCGICFDALDCKRSVTLKPCDHQFHRTCALQWAASGRHEIDRPCCLCRTSVKEMIGRNGRRAVRPSPFEEEEFDMKRVVLEGLLKEGDRLLQSMSNARDQIRKLLKESEIEKVIAEKQRKSEEFIADIDEEIGKLVKRKHAIDNLLAYGARITALGDAAAIAYAISREMEALDSLDSDLASEEEDGPLIVAQSRNDDTDSDSESEEEVR